MRAGALLVVLSIVLAGCGSRVSDDQTAAVQAGSQAGAFEVPDGSGSEPVTAGATASETVTAGGTATGRGTATGARRPGVASAGAGPASQSGGGGGGALTASAPGVTASEIKIGLVYDKGAGTANAAFGFAGIGQIDTRRAYDALIADINERGGIGGRKLVPVYATFDTAGPDAQAGVDVLEQRFCNTFTENRVFVTFYGGQETFTRCMNELGVVRVGSDDADSQLIAESPLLVILNAVLDRVAAFSVERLGASHYYDKGKNDEKDLKIGLIRYDEPAYDRASAVLKKSLEARGLRLDSEVAIRNHETVDQIQDTTNAVRAAVLKFKSEGITHVQFLTNYSAFTELIFMQNAEKQLYHPRYGLTSLSSPQALSVLLGSDSRSQLAGTVTVGWFPIFDVHASEYSGDKTTAAFRRCIQVLEESGETFTEGDPTRNKEALAALACDLFGYFETAAKAAGANLTSDSFMGVGVPSVDNLDSAATFILSTSQRRDAYGGVRDGRWDDDCPCFTFVNPTIYRV